jgi:hypothetical protein
MPSKISEPIRVLAALALLAIAAPVASAQTAGDREAARIKLREGSQHLRDGEYADALKSFEVAYRLVPSPKIHFNFALSYEGLARYADALESFELFVSQAKDASAANLTQAREEMQELKKKVAFLSVTCDQAGASIVVDGHPRAKVPQARPLPVDPGLHQLVVELAGKVSARSFAAEAGKRIDLVVSLVEPSRAPPPSAPPPRETPSYVAQPAPAIETEETPLYRRTWPWVVGAAIVAGAVTTGLLLSRHAEYPQATLGERTVPR